MIDELSLNNVKWAAKLGHVREVSLTGTADLEFWTRHLEDQGLSPVEEDGRAQVMIVSAQSRFMGVPFRELSFSVRVQPLHDDGIPEAAFLIQAFNSSRFFAFCERTIFATPYQHADVYVSTELPASFQLKARTDIVLEAQLNADNAKASRSPEITGPKTWQAEIHLPRKSARNAGRRKRFIARIQGETQEFAFDGKYDVLSLASNSGLSALQSLHDSRFVPTRWELRPDASHAKSKTYSQSS